ncbi:MAG: hypothetical protein LBQ44_01690 [Treponema sp.]|jgi:uncharacterized protein (DUF427 family)|nr:hypothetical protein [Treponema sp.]
MKKILIVLLSFICAGVLGAQTFSWDLGIESSSKGFLNSTRAMRLSGSEKFFIKVKPERNCYCYIVQREEDGRISILYEGPLTAGAERSVAPGLSSRSATFYVIVDSVRQENLDRLIAAFRQDPAAVKGNAVYSEVLKVQREVHALGEPAVQFTSVSGATSRNAEDRAPAGYSRQSGKSRYVKTFIVRR